MLGTRIVPAVCLDSVNFKYSTYGQVHRVFDSTPYDELIPVAFSANGNKFDLHHAPGGRIFVETTKF